MTLPKRSYMKVTGLALACSSLLFSCAPKEVPQVNLIPKPAHIEVTGGYFKVDSNLVFGNDQSGTIRYVVDESFNGGNPEGYALNVTKKGGVVTEESTDGITTSIIENNIFCYPSKTSGTTTLNYVTTECSDVLIDIFSIDGKKLI